VSENFALRRAGIADVPAIVRLINLAYRVEAFFVAGERIDAPEVEALLARGAFLLAEREGALLGAVFVEDRRDHGYVGLLSVDPGLQRAGIGRALMAAAEAELAALGRRRVEIVVVDLREELPPWYRRLGYREVGTRPFPPEDRVLRPCHFMVMSKRLGR
jgi:ribosomal protein S18 acetylase RimI-like enzyme